MTTLSNSLQESVINQNGKDRENWLFLSWRHHLSVNNSEDGEDDDEEEEFPADEFVQGALERERER